MIKSGEGGGGVLIKLCSFLSHSCFYKLFMVFQKVERDLKVLQVIQVWACRDWTDHRDPQVGHIINVPKTKTMSSHKLYVCIYLFGGGDLNKQVAKPVK